MYIRNFTETGKDDVMTVGGKGANLGELTRAGLPVPAGFVVTAQAYRYFLESSGLKEKTEELLRGAQTEAELLSAASAIRKAIRTAEFPEDLEQEIRKAYRGLSEEASKQESREAGRGSSNAFPEEESREAGRGSGKASPLARVAVRSSATAEDLPEASFAGQQETCLNVIGEKELIDSVRICYASLWGDRAVVYRQNHGYDQASVSLAAVVQQMVESEKAGVLFTANPVTGNRDEMVINASYGLGEAVVSGQVTPDSYVCTKDGTVKSAVIGSKEIQIIYRDGSSAQDAEKSSDTITPDEITVNERTSDEITSNEITPDAIAPDERTQPAEEDSRAAGGTVRVRVSEAMQKARAISEEEIRELCAQARKIEAHYAAPMDIEWAIAGGRVYMLQARAITTLKEKIPEELIESCVSKNKVSARSNKNLIFTLEKIPEAQLPFDFDAMNAINGRREALLEECGIRMNMQPQIDDDGVTILPDGKLSIDKNLFRIPRILKEMGDVDRCLQQLDDHLPPLKKRLEELRRIDMPSLDAGQCAEWIEAIDTYVRELADVRFRYALFPNAIVGNSVNKALRKVDKNLTQYDLLADLTYKTAVVNADIAALAQKARSLPGCAEAIQSRTPYEEIHRTYPELADMLDRFMAEHGYKTDFNCYCVKARSFREDPDRVLRIMTPLLDDAQTGTSKEAHSRTGTPKEAHSQTGASKEDHAYSALLKKIQGTYSGRKYEELKHRIEALRAIHVIREDTQYMWEEAFYYLRRILERAAYLLTGDSDVYRSVAYLRMGEAEQALQEGRLSETMREKIRRRIEKRPLAEAVWERSKALAFTKNQNGQRAAEVLKGVSGSSGVAVGRACVIREPGEFYKMEKGVVLVCPYTDPEWTPLFRLASAVVADTGGNLSHAAIVAREYGIPAVLGVGFATTRYKDGDLVRVDGDRGEVTAAS